MEFEPIWGAPIAMYLFLAGLGAGAFVAATAVGRMAPQAKRTVRAGRVIALGAVAVGLVLLMVDAKGGFLHPWRFALLLGNVQSVMTWGVVFLAAFVVIAAVVVVRDLLRKSVPFGLEAAGCGFAIAVAMYTGVLLGVVKTFPLWNSAVLPFLFLVSAMSTGVCAVFLFARLVCPSEVEKLAFLERVHGWLPWVETVLVAALLFFVGLSSEAGAASVVALLTGQWALVFWLGFVVVGLALPLVLHLAQGRVGAGVRDACGAEVHGVCPQVENGRACGAVSDVATIVGGFLLRYLVVMAALPVVLL
ncbi:Polysulfide reductase, NrfD [Coriobacteriaceae bacterium CHKCI002]|nr:Polysulfide reductase, NrfD [Coriobacteriaceae bacterium CHKCI002]